MSVLVLEVESNIRRSSQERRRRGPSTHHGRLDRRHRRCARRRAPRPAAGKTRAEPARYPGPSRDRTSGIPLGIVRDVDVWSGPPRRPYGSV